MGTLVGYFDWIEYSLSWKSYRKGTLLGFLKKDEKIGTYRTIDEGAVFRLSPAIGSFMERIR